jgi:hypothetical protein
VGFNRDERTVGETGYTFKKMLSFAMDGITAFSDSPLKFASTLGFFGFRVFVSRNSLCFVFQFYIK